MKLNKEKFLQTELGQNMSELVTAWDKALNKINMCMDNPHDSSEYSRAFKTVRFCQVQWGVYQLIFKQFYNIDCHFSKTEDAVNIVTDGEKVLFSFERKV